MSYPAVLPQLKGHKNEWLETGYIVILTRSTSAAAWQSTELIKRFESPSLYDSFHSSDEWKA